MEGKPTGKIHSAPDSPVVDTLAENASFEVTEGATQCTYNNQNYDPGEYTCQSRLEMRCASNGKWVKTGQSC